MTTTGSSVPPVELTPATSASAVAHWALLETLFRETLAQDANGRTRYLEQVAPDPALRAEVEALIAAHEARGVLDSLESDVMQPLRVRGARGRDDAAPASVPSRYRMLERVGSGGMGVVYRARDERLERDVALKFLPARLSADPRAKERFLLEARAAAALAHPNICTVHEIGDTEDGSLYIVMAFHDGETLNWRIARGPLPVEEALRITSDIARGLARAHERGIVHCDIKPANVMVTADGHVTILDFGIARLVDASPSTSATVAGTVAYMSPEQAFGEPLDLRTDLWSLGVVLYEMLAGVRPFRGADPQAILFSSLAAEPEPIHRRRPDVSPSVDALLRRALAKRPDERFESASEMLDALASCASEVLLATASTDDDTAEWPVPDFALAGGERRQVAVVACTLDGHEALVERLAPADLERLLARTRDLATDVATRHEGIINHFSGNSLVMLFGVPTAHEDDALRGVRAAIELQSSVADLLATLAHSSESMPSLRIGVHAGTVVAQRLREGDRRYRVVGAPMDVASRLADASAPASILLSGECQRLVTPFVLTEPSHPVSLRPDAPPLLPHRVLGTTGVRSRLEDAARRGLTPFVGRQRERAVLQAQLAEARKGAGGVTLLVGEAGSGKSRLLHELRSSATATAVRVLAGRCDAYGSGTPFLPFVESARQALGLPPDLAPMERHDAVVAAVRDLGPDFEEFLPLYLALLGVVSAEHEVAAQLRGELFQSAMLEAIAALFTIGARSVPTLLLLDDWQFADAASRAALRQLHEVAPRYPLLVVVTARPDQPIQGWLTDAERVLHLPPLDDAASAAIAAAVFGGGRIAPELATYLHAHTGGNPFFLEELCAALQELGAVAEREGEIAATLPADAVHVPDTVQSVLRTRIDRVDPVARDVLRVASVIGTEFTLALLEEVSSGEGSVGSAMKRLAASGLVIPVVGTSEPTYRFKHALTQEVAYGSLLAHQRLALHGAVGHAVERSQALRLEDQAARLSYHFAQAEMWEEAVGYGLQAAEQAARLSQTASALEGLERTERWILRLPDDAARRDLRAEVLLRQERLCEMLGLRARQLALVESLVALLAPHGPSERLAQAYLRRGDAYTLLHRFEVAERALETACQISAERGDAAGERNALRSIALLRMYEGRHDEALATIERVLELARAVGDLRAEAGDLATQANVLRAKGQHHRALEVLEAALDRTGAADNPVRYAALLHVIGLVHRDLGDREQALACFQRVSFQGLDPRHAINASFTLPAIAELQLEGGQVEEALATYREAVELNRRARYADGLAHVCRSLGEALMGLGRAAEAVAPLREAAELFAQLEDPETESLMQRHLATVHERLGAATDARSAWHRALILNRTASNLAGEAEAAEGVARADRLLHAATERVIAEYDEALTLALRLGDAARELSVRNALGIVHWERGAYADAMHQYEAALRICRASGDRVHEALILNSLGATLHRQHRCDEARATLGDAVRVAREAGERQLEAYALATLGDVYLAGGRLADACGSVESSLELRRELADRRGEGWMLERLARVRVAQGRLADANVLLEDCAVIAQEIADGPLQDALTRLRPFVGQPDSPLS